MTITHPDKVLFPDDGITKADLAAYYGAVASVMLPHLRGRPITMERYPAGISAKGFLQKNVIRGFPAWLKRVETPKKNGTVFYPLAADRASLQWMANQNAVTLHVWTSCVPHLERPDMCVFDLDPLREEPEVLRNAALGLRDVLAELHFESRVKTSGSKGFHVVVPLTGRRTTHDNAAQLADRVAAIMVQRQPKHLTQAFRKADRGGRILIDTARNQAGATIAAAYTVRARPGAPVSAPCTWEEIERGDVGPQTFSLRSMPERIAAVGDLWKALLPTRRPTRG